MLKIWRNKKVAQWIWIILAIIIIPAFVLFGSGSIGRGKKTKDVVGKIFGRPVTALEYKDAFEAVRNQAIMRMGEAYFEMEKYMNLYSLAEERLILEYEAKKRRIKVTDKEVVEYLQNVPLFWGKNGFDKQRYYQTLQIIFRTPPRIFEEQLRRSIAIAKLFDEITKEISVNEDEIKKEYIKFNEEYSIEYIESKPQDFVKEFLPSEEELKDYYTKNSLYFKEPLSFNLEYVSLPFGSEDDEEARQHIESVWQKFKKNKSFSETAAKLGLTVKETGFFKESDPIPGIGWSSQISTALFKAKPNDLLGPVYSDKYVYIFRLKERKEPTIPEFEKIKEKVKEVWIKEKSYQLAKKKIEDCFTILKEKFSADPNSISLEKEAKNLNLKYGQTTNFKFSSYIEGIGSSDAFFEAASQLKEKEFSSIISTPQAFYIIRTKTHLPIDENKFLREKEEFRKKILLQKKEEYFNRYLKELKEKSQRF